MTTYRDAVNDALERLDDLGYERNLGGGDLANHGPMAAEALAVLGHGEVIPEWVRVYRRAAPHHEPPVPYQRLDGADEADWRAALGDIGRAGDFEELFVREIAEQGWQAVLTRWWPRLLPGPMTGLTHGLIRTAHAVRGLGATDRPTPLQVRELARGLGYWAARFIDAPGRGRLVGKLAVPAAVAAVGRLPQPVGSPQEGLTRMRNPRSMSGYAEALDTLAPDHTDRLLSDMTAHYAGVCVAHTDSWFPIPLLHGVTAPAAARLVLPHLPPELHEPTVAALWQAQVTLLMMVTTSPAGEDDALDRARQAQPPAWDELIARAVDHRDEHVIKFTEACLREHALRPDPRYAWAVDIAQQRIERPDAAGGSAVEVRFRGATARQ
ncbi:questin oxidase family protein [Nocardia wallacei]|uniref:questin oxidase family protein n=1 Tax=Nocardia wallacei TaxID=480035 RepID=UPI0024538E8B|nr:questin oxidase family protein [Nocardia wallacei]